MSKGILKAIIKPRKNLQKFPKSAFDSEFEDLFDNEDWEEKSRKLQIRRWKYIKQHSSI